MARDLKAQLELTADASGVEAGVGKAKKSLASLGASAAAEGRKAAEGLESIGSGGDAAAKRVDRSTRNLIGSIQRTTATLEAGGRSSSKYFETLASQRGVDAGVLKPYLDQLDAVRARQAVASAELTRGGAVLNQYGVSAKQTAAAMRGVPAQLTDIFTSLQGGQAPLTVLLQQGGQLKDMFGGVVPAARALGGAVLGLLNPFTVAATAVATLGLAYFQGSKEADAYARAVILSGDASGKTIGQLQEMAERIAAVGGTQSAAAEAVAEFGGSTALAGANIERFSALAVKMERVTGQAVGETRKQFEALAGAPLQASIKLNESTNFLTASLYKQIQALEAQGRTAEAAALAMNAYAADGENKLAKLQDRLGYLESAWLAVASGAKKAWDFMLNVGRPDTLEDQLARAQDRLAALRSNQGAAALARRPLVAGAADPVAQAQEQVRILQSRLGAEGRLADAQARSAASVKARIAFDKEADKYLSREVQQRREIARFNELADKAGASAAERERGLAGIREKFKGPKGKTEQIGKAQLGLDLQDIRSAGEQLVATYANSERILESIRAAGLLSDREYYEAKRAFLALEGQAKEAALQQEIERYQRETLTGKDKIDNERRIAEASAKLALLRAENSSKMVVLDNQEAAALKRVAAAYLSARQAAEDYLAATNQQQERSIAGIGRGNQQRDRDAGINQIEDRYAGQRRDLENNRAQLELEGKFTDEARQQYQARLAIINEFQGKATASFLSYFDRLTAAQANWSNGANEALNNYLSQSQNVAQQVENLFTNAFQGMESALSQFIKTGKLDFGDLAKSIVADVTSIIIKLQIVGPLVQALKGSMGGGGGLEGFFTSLFGGGRAIGGPVSAGQLYQVNERRPELLNVGGKQFLMMGSQGGRVQANAPATSSQVNNMHFNFTLPATVDRRTQEQIASMTGAAVNRSLRRLA